MNLTNLQLIKSNVYSAFNLVSGVNTSLFIANGVLKSFTKLKQHKRYKFTKLSLVGNGLLYAFASNTVGVVIGSCFQRDVFPLITTWTIASICNSLIKIVVCGFMYCIEKNDQITDTTQDHEQIIDIEDIETDHQETE